ncbi:hypothetical protein McanCB56680_003592 [Microsporum canis]|uniref:Uncharacterized protein n=1 Tax=Arthroderma otae (strain ATCC MYA-4605 / CBS 113480) TaxID=554155 RepID=C5FRS2_ARTOC|nr:conserved hypothetical protein [Microsporum canis CBS 113480]EEQ32575.1 conserved hypothetical protein [Microsporum canis CBS 113480]
MDGGDSHPQKKYDPSYIAGRVVRDAPGSSADRFRQQQPGSTRRGTLGTGVTPQDGTALPPYGGFDYPESTPYNTSQLQSGSLQYQQGFPNSRNPPQPGQQSTSQEQQQRLQQYDHNIVYNINPHDQTPSSYYQPRQSAAIEVLANQFGVPQYFPPDESTAGAGASAQYLSPQDQPPTFPQLPPVSRPGVATSFAESMPGFNSTSGSEPQERQEATQQRSSDLDEAYNRYQQTLKQAFYDIRAGRLANASDSMLEMSEWLLGNAVELGLVRDQEDLHADRIDMWNNFNTCWLAICQKQKDTTQEMFDTGVRPAELLSEDALQKLGRELVRLCDKMEQYGLVDYQMGVWEEEILCVLGQCLDLLENHEEASAPSRNRLPTADQ